MPPLSAAMSKAVPFASKTRLTRTPPYPPLPHQVHRLSPFPTDLPISSGFDSLLVVVDHGLTKGAILCPTKKSITAEGIASLFFHKVFLCFGLFDKVISDRGPQFASSFARELGKLLHYDLSLSTAYHPQSDGETERVNQEVEPTSVSFVAIIPHLGPNRSPMQNSSTTTALTPSPINLHSIS